MCVNELLRRSAVLFALTVAAANAVGGSVMQLAPERVLAAADTVFEGTIESARPYHSDGARGAILTDYSIVVSQTFSDRKGELAARLNGKRIVLTFSGGRVGDTEDITHGVPKLTVGERAFFFIHHRDWGASSPILGMWQGLYRVQNDRVVRAGGCCAASLPVRSHFFAPTVTAPDGFTAEEFAEEIARALPLAAARPDLTADLTPPVLDELPEGVFDARTLATAAVGESDQAGSGSDGIAAPVWTPRQTVALPDEPAQIINIDRPDDVSVIVPPRPFVSNRFGFFSGSPSFPVTFNVQPAMGSFQADTLNMMGYWNLNADIFRVHENPTSTFTFGNNRNEIGFATSAILIAQGFRTWGATEYAVARSRQQGGRIIETDVYFNVDPGHTWSSEFATVAANSLACPNGSCAIVHHFPAVCIHELGHAFGLQHQWVPNPMARFPSVMNYYSVNELFDTGSIFADDANGARAAYGTRPRLEGIIKLWYNDGTLSTDASGVPDGNGTQDTIPADVRVAQGGTLNIGSGTGASARFWTIDNPGTIAVAQQVNFYLTPAYGSFTGAIYLGTANPAPITPGGSAQLQRSVIVPASTPPGLYHVAAQLLIGADDNPADNVAWSFNRVGVIPPNDSRSSPVAMSQHGGTFNGTTLAASFETGFGGGCFSNNTPDVWYSIVPPTAGQLVLDTCGSPYDTVLEVLDGIFVPVPNGCNDDSAVCGGNGRQSRVVINVTGGSTYNIRVSGFNGAIGNFVLRAAFYPGNDVCWNSSGLQGPTASLSTGVWAAGSTIGATATPTGEVPACLFFNSQSWVNLEGNSDVWFRWTAGCASPAAVVTVASTWLQVAVYRGCYNFLCCDPQPTLVACGALENGTENPWARWTPEAGVNYYIRVLTYSVPVNFQVAVFQSTANDHCVSAPTVSVSSAGVNVVCDTRCAVPSSGGLAPGQCSDVGGGGPFDMGADVYHRLNIQTTGTLRITRCNGSYLPSVALYPACPDAVTPVDAVACGYSSSSSCAPVIITHPVVAGQQLLMRTGGYPGSINTGVTTLTLTITPPATGACCQASGACAATAAADCAGFYSGDGSACNPNPCPQPVGACCTTTACTVASSAVCAGGGGTYQGTGTPCLGQPGNRITCCAANFNAEGGITVQDLFDFMAAYFAGDLRADINRSATITVQDLFDFLGLYFQGCP